MLAIASVNGVLKIRILLLLSIEAICRKGAGHSYSRKTRVYDPQWVVLQKQLRGVKFIWIRHTIPTSKTDSRPYVSMMYYVGCLAPGFARNTSQVL